MASKQWYFLLLFLGLTGSLSALAQEVEQENIVEKRTQLAMRMIGHEILLSVGNCESRVLPIEQIDNQYKIPFGTAFSFDPDTIIAVVGRVVQHTQVASDYFVEVRQCGADKMVHAFEIRNARYAGMIPCGGRILPEDCYYLLITILDGFSPYAQPLPPSSDRSALNYVLPILLALVGGGVYWWNKKQPPSPKPQAATAVADLIQIGASQFDKINGQLFFQDQRIELSNKESELLVVLHASANVPIARERILQRVWGDEGDYVGRTLDVFISKLRKKLAVDTSLKIVNIRGVGYKLITNNPQ
ncbi:MAG: winged helix-turn-helix domain-containing protein [Bacteroidota bacterium]